MHCISRMKWKWMLHYMYVSLFVSLDLLALRFVLDDDFIRWLWLLLLFIWKLWRISIQLHLSLQFVCTSLINTLQKHECQKKIKVNVFDLCKNSKNHILWLAFLCSVAQTEKGIFFLSASDNQPQTTKKKTFCCSAQINYMLKTL